jgi:hypothetical protein
MKIRIAIAALLIASFLGFGFVRAVYAASVCAPIDTESDKEVHQCSGAYDVDAAAPMGGFLWVTSVKDYANLPNLPNTDFLGNAINVWVVDMNGAAVSPVHLEVCIADASSSGNVYMWSGSTSSLYSVKNAGSWMALPTFHLPGWDCASSAFPGVFSAN